MLSRFYKAQEHGVRARNSTYEQALQQIQDFKKIGDWIWYMLPQFASLGKSQEAKYYGVVISKENALVAKHQGKNRYVN
jgi:uncharacterized protein (DUF1810 family)